MEIIIGLIVLGFVGYFVFFRKKDEPLTPAAPYKVDAPAPVVTNSNPADNVPVAESAPAVVEEAPAVVEEAPAKAPRKPRAPKAEAVAKKPAAKKAAPKKAAAIKAKPKATRSKKV